MKLENVVDQCRESTEKSLDSNIKVHTFLRSPLSVQLPLHISLSAPLVLKTDTKDAFAAAIKEKLSISGAHSFATHAVSVAWVSNFDDTRSFLVLKLLKPDNDDLNKLLSACNRCAGDLGLDMLYQSQGSERLQTDKSDIDDQTVAFHISIAWSLAKAQDLGEPKVQAEMLNDLKDVSVSFDSVKLKIGNVVMDIALPSYA